MDYVWQWVSYAFIIAILVGVSLVVSRCDRAQPGEGYDDIDGFSIADSKAIDASANVDRLERGQAICYRLGSESPMIAVFGWVAALPGDEVALRGGWLVVNGQPCKRGDSIPLPACAPIRVPRDHVMVLSDHHRFDSVAYGPIPAGAIRGRVASVP
jgi:type IV secretory pathway protease TraF